jgi:hypothetical protein
MQALSVLLTNNALATPGGSETYIRDVALALLRRGHRPVAFSLVHGGVAEELRRATVPVIADLAQLGARPDVIHGHHHLETLIAALAFPDTPIVHFCHGWVPWEELPLRHPSVRRYVAVDEVCFDRLVREEGIPPARVEILHNFVDLDRFRARPPLPARPARALVLSNYATADGYARIIAAACREAGISLDVAGGASGRLLDAPETALRSCDLVFAKGRTALEALAVGCAVIVADAAGAGPLVTPGNFATLRSRNFGIRELCHAHDPAWYRSQIAAYDRAAAGEVSDRVRACAGMDGAIDRLLTIYASAQAAAPGDGDGARAAADHLCRIAQPLKQAYANCQRIRALEHDLELARGERDALVRADSTHAAARQRHVAALERDLASARASARALESQIDAFRALPTLRLRNAVLRAPVVGRALQAAARRLANLLGP